MKKLFLSLFIIGGMLFVQSCKDDDKKPSNQVSYDGEKVKISKVLYEVDQDGEALFYHGLLILSEGLELTDGNIQGTGDALELAFVTSYEEDLKAGVYTVSESEEENTLEGELYVDVIIDNENEQFGAILPVESGTVTVEKNGDTYTLVFDLVVDGKKLTGTYKGVFSSWGN